MAYPPNSPPPLGSDDDDDFGDFETVFDQQCTGNDVVKNRIDFDTSSNLPIPSNTSSSPRSLPPDIPPFSPDFSGPSIDHVQQLTSDFTKPIKEEISQNDSFSLDFSKPFESAETPADVFTNDNSCTSGQIYEAATDMTTSTNMTSGSSPEQVSTNQTDDQDDFFADFSSFSNVTSCNIESISNPKGDTDDSGSHFLSSYGEEHGNVQLCNVGCTMSEDISSSSVSEPVTGLVDNFSETPVDELTETPTQIDSNKTDATMFVPDFTVPFESIQGVEDLSFTTPSPVKNAAGMKSVFSWDSSESEASPKPDFSSSENSDKDGNINEQLDQVPIIADEFDTFTVQSSAPADFVPFAGYEENNAFESNKLGDQHIDKDNCSVEKESNKDLVSADEGTTTSNSIKNNIQHEEHLKNTHDGESGFDHFAKFSTTQDTGDIFGDFSSKDGKAESVKIDDVTTANDNIDLHEVECSDPSPSSDNSQLGFADFSKGKATSPQEDEALFSSAMEDKSGTHDEFANFTDHHSAQDEGFAEFPSINKADDNFVDDDDFDDFAEFEAVEGHQNVLPAPKNGGFANFTDHQSVNNNTDVVEEDDDFDDFAEFETVESHQNVVSPYTQITTRTAEELPLNEVISTCYKESLSSNSITNDALLSEQYNKGRYLMGKVNEVDAQFAVGSKWIASPSYIKMLNTLCLSISSINTQHPQTKSAEVLKPANNSNDAFDVFGSIDTAVSNPMSLLPDDLASVAETKTIQPAKHADILSAYTKSPENQKLSPEAQAIVDSLPDLSFMLSPVLMFPVKG